MWKADERFRPEAGVAHATVSRALAGNLRINEAT
ncbi:MAG TPA: LacI family DNA-binding transcriptional regulator [Candidatus Acetothermia bacterium]|nr:LacI family DNA-binding transcriptional regulator [Candidatus Acetothermia bacterium]